jgi:hypothetical protein
MSQILVQKYLIFIFYWYATSTSCILISCFTSSDDLSGVCQISMNSLLGKVDKKQTIWLIEWFYYVLILFLSVKDKKNIRTYQCHIAYSLFLNKFFCCSIYFYDNEPPGNFISLEIKVDMKIQIHIFFKLNCSSSFDSYNFKGFCWCVLSQKNITSCQVSLKSIIDWIKNWP